MFLRFVIFLVHIHDSADVVDSIHAQLCKWRHLSTDRRTLAGVQSKNRQLWSDEVLRDVRDEVERSGCACVLRQRKVFIEVSEVGRERKQVIRTRPVLQPEAGRTLQAVFELIPEARRWYVNPGNAIYRRRAATPRKSGRSPDVRPEPRPRTCNKDGQRALPVLLEHVKVLGRDPCLRQTKQSTVVKKSGRATTVICRFTRIIYIKTVAVDVAVNAVLLVRCRLRSFVRRWLRCWRAGWLIAFFRLPLLPVLWCSGPGGSETIDNG